MTVARATKELSQGTGVTWAAETDRRLKQALGLPQATASYTTAQLWDLYMVKKGFVLGSHAVKMAQFLASQSDRTLTETYAALLLVPYAGSGRD